MRFVRAAILALLGTVASTMALAHEGHDGSHPTATAATPPAAASPAPVVFRVRPGARADLGWTGIAHGQDWPADQRLGFAVACRDGDENCAALGGAPGDFFGSPVPLSSGGVPACVVNRLKTAVTGAVQPKLGCAQLELHLAAAVFLGEEVARPCPTCVGDATANDGRRDGHCQGGATDGAACDAHGATTHLGAVSTDCLPSSRKSVGELTIDLAPLGTGETSLRAALTCTGAPGKDAARCFCPAQIQASACLGGRCGSDGRCVEGPLDGNCSGAPYRSCMPGSGRAECEAQVKGGGECVTSLRPCFHETLPVAGHCDVDRPTYAAVFCVPATGATALNSVAGLPGPARLVLPLERVAPPSR